VGFFLYQDFIVFNSSQATFFLIGCIATLALLTIIFQQLFKPRQKFFPKRVITTFESKMFIRLKEAFPQHHILAQVAFSALITNDNFKIRNKFNRKVTDFVLLNQKLEVVAIIELDDPSHLGKEQEDAERDAMLNEAGYQVYRYMDIPSVHNLKKDILNNSISA